MGANRKRRISELESAMINKNYIINRLQLQVDSFNDIKKKARTLNDFVKKFYSNFYSFCKYVKSSDLKNKNKAKLNFKLKNLISNWDNFDNNLISDILVLERLERCPI